MNLVIQNLSFSHDKLRLLKINFTMNNITTVLKNLQGYPSGIVYNPENKKIYMSDIVNSKSISVIDPTTNTVIKNIPVSDRNYNRGDLIYNPSNGYVYVTSIINNTSTVSIINSTTNKVIKNIPLGNPDSTFERNLIYNPTNGYVYLSVKDSGLQVIKYK